MKADHSFNIECATLWGVPEAVMIHHIAYWVNKNAANKKHLYDGFAWTYNTYEAFSELHPYWTKSQTARLLTKLEDLGCIQSSQIMKGDWNRVKWYTVLSPVRDIYGMLDFDDTKMNVSKTRNRDIEDTKPCSLTTVKKLQLEKESTVIYPFQDQQFISFGS